ncbi:NupC/NupG family nucleoside CNT transporter [Brachybacterium ginsengisoli]|uniref:NupC/NupG family nucleoside CNT transporter n=1 Tax=Brachybacterium ginsengisoli TaxID=1331682 RepID=A0A291GSX1_9MICO|nr:nucleoside transporter C-terminal domain-containing protein [Brachybacterium ginsengisoli]ATG53361.1 NupC/NupG family nucleoside CNT transporter [Brachybacterium ginsengisoli]
MYLALNILGVAVFLALGWLFSKNRRAIRWKSVGLMVALNAVIAWFLTSFPVGRAAVRAAAEGFAWLVDVSYEGISFALQDWVGPTGVDPEPVNFVVSALLPILLIVPLFDILSYLGVLPFVIRWVGRGLSFVTRQPRFETFFAVEMMFLGNTEALAVSRAQLKHMSPQRTVTIAMMSMSCVTAALIGAYTQLVPAEFVLTAVPLNCINALLMASLLFPVEVPAEEDVIVGVGTVEADVDAEPDAEPAGKPEREPFFSFLGDSILGAGRIVLIVLANVIAFVALAALVNQLLGLLHSGLSLQAILGVVLFVPAMLLGLDPATATEVSQMMGLKLVTNEFVVMGQITGDVGGYDRHHQAVLTVFLTSFANLSTVGMIIGAFKGLVDREKNELISRNVGRMLLAGVLVSLLSAALVGVFVW